MNIYEKPEFEWIELGEIMDTITVSGPIDEAWCTLIDLMS